MLPRALVYTRCGRKILVPLPSRACRTVPLFPVHSDRGMHQFDQGSLAPVLLSATISWRIARGFILFSLAKKVRCHQVTCGPSFAAARVGHYHASTSPPSQRSKSNLGGQFGTCLLTSFPCPPPLLRIKARLHTNTHTQTMELRAVQTAMLAGRTASRWATTSTTLHSTATFARHISSSRSRRQEAEAAAPPSEAPRPTNSSPPSASPSMAAYAQRRQQQQSDTAGLRSIFSQPSYSSSESSSIAPQDSRNNNVATWARPSATGLARQERKTTEAINSLFGAGAKSLIGAAPSKQDLYRLQSQRDRPFPEEIKLRLRPVLGRGVKVAENTDFARALEVLGQRCTMNRVAADARSQRFHERPGLKRKRLKSSRWRSRFRLGFRATCDRVSELAMQGW